LLPFIMADWAFRIVCGWIGWKEVVADAVGQVVCGSVRHVR